VTVIDYGSSNLRSVVKAFERAAHERSVAAHIEITGDAERVRSADRIVLTGCRSLCQLPQGAEQGLLA